MSFEDVNALRRARKSLRDLGVTGTEFSVLLALADRKNGKTGRCNPSLETLAEDTLWSEHTIQRTVKSLRERGILEIEDKGRSFQYTLNIPRTDGGAEDMDEGTLEDIDIEVSNSRQYGITEMPIWHNRDAIEVRDSSQYGITEMPIWHNRDAIEVRDSSQYGITEMPIWHNRDANMAPKPRINQEENLERVNPEQNQEQNPEQNPEQNQEDRPAVAGSVSSAGDEDELEDDFVEPIRRVKSTTAIPTPVHRPKVSLNNVAGGGRPRPVAKTTYTSPVSSPSGTNRSQERKASVSLSLSDGEKLHALLRELLPEDTSLQREQWYDGQLAKLEAVFTEKITLKRYEAALRWVFSAQNDSYKLPALSSAAGFFSLPNTAAAVIGAHSKWMEKNYLSEKVSTLCAAPANRAEEEAVFRELSRREAAKKAPREVDILIANGSTESREVLIERYIEEYVERDRAEVHAEIDRMLNDKEARARFDRERAARLARENRRV